MLIVIPRQPLRKIAPKYSKRNKGIKMIYYKIFNRKEGSNRGTQEQKRHQTCRIKSGGCKSYLISYSMGCKWNTYPNQKAKIGTKTGFN